MGNTEKKPSPPPLIPIEPRVLSCSDVQERRLRKSLPKRLGSMLLSQWILLKRREQGILERAKKAVLEGKAPSSFLEEIKQYLDKSNKKRKIKYHPKILDVIFPKRKLLKKPGLRLPKLTNTAARRLQHSFRIQDSQKIQQKQLGDGSPLENRRKSLVRNNVPGSKRSSARPLAWSEKKESTATYRVKPITSTFKKPKMPRDVKSPTQDLSIQSASTNETFGPSRSRASSVSSVTYSIHKILYNRRRVSKVKILACHSKCAHRHDPSSTFDNHILPFKLQHRDCGRNHGYSASRPTIKNRLKWLADLKQQCSYKNKCIN
ncbi:hypothetical protein SK128_012721 [Halocaridina rubra]|uniref:Uncharacterized protein n=1 Tax=Halocaridina rubra TaxID=373956 RepID=A0AAN8XJW8_HALRR